MIETDQQWLESELGLNFLEWMTGNGSLIRNEERAIELNSVGGFYVDLCKELYDHLASGKSYESYGAKRGLLPSTKKRFENMIPEWRFAKEIGMMAGMEKMEDKGLGLIDGRDGAKVWQKWMESQYGWSTTKKVEVQGEVVHNHKLVSVKSSVPLEMDDETYTDAQISG